MIPDELKTTYPGQLFLQYDSGPNYVNRSIIFGTQKSLEYMVQCRNWFADDGTFKAASRIFGQLYTIHGATHTN